VQQAAGKYEPLARHLRHAGALLALAALLTAGCKNDKAGEATAAAREPAGQAARWHRLVVAGGSTTETLFALGVGDRIVAVDTSSFYPQAETAKLPKIGYHRALSSEGILSLRPDAVLVSNEAGPPAALAQVRRAGVHVEVIPAEPSVAGAVHRLRHLAGLFDKKARGEELVARVEADLEAARKVVAARARRPRVLSLYTRGPGTILVGGTTTPAAEMIGLAGGDSVVPFEGWKPMVAEAVATANPDIVVVTTRGLQSIGGMDALFALPGVPLSRAGKEKRVVVMEDLLFSGFGPRLGQAVLELAQGFTAQRSASVEGVAGGPR
jgi:iron complex transport system substrate-binding protein